MVSTILHIRPAVFGGGVAKQVGFYVLNAVVSLLIAYWIERLGAAFKRHWQARGRRTVCPVQARERRRRDKEVDPTTDRTLNFDWPAKGGTPKSDGVQTETVEKQRHGEEGRPARRRRPR